MFMLNGTEISPLTIEDCIIDSIDIAIVLMVNLFKLLTIPLKLNILNKLV